MAAVKTVKAFSGICRGEMKSARRRLDSLSNIWAVRLATQQPPLFSVGEQATIDAARVLLTNKLLATRQA
jgi:hypothetical protein